MKLKASQLNDSISKAGKSLFCFLFYGADFGAVRHAADEVISFVKKQDSAKGITLPDCKK